MSFMSVSADRLVGATCYVNNEAGESRCRFIITHAYFLIEDKWPFSLNVIVVAWPINDSLYSEDDLFDFIDGMLLEDIYDIELPDKIDNPSIIRGPLPNVDVHLN